MSEELKNKRRPALLRAAFRVLLVALVFGVWLLFIYDDSPLSDAWNPLVPLNVKDERTSFTKWKLQRALSGSAACLSALETGASAKALPDFEQSEMCHIRPQVVLSRVGSAALDPVNTRCQTALRMAMWERHGIQPAAQRILGAQVRRISHFSSYNCRQMRTTRGGSIRMSTHATANSIDISGFVLSDGSSITLKQDWQSEGVKAQFLREVRDSACDWFRLTLGPDYNALHADHFHLQHAGWGLCR